MMWFDAIRRVAAGELGGRPPMTVKMIEMLRGPNNPDKEPKNSLQAADRTRARDPAIAGRAGESNKGDRFNPEKNQL